MQGERKTDSNSVRLQSVSVMINFRKKESVDGSCVGLSHHADASVITVSQNKDGRESDASHAIQIAHAFKS